jgi:Ca-activated chloride channel family protein
MGDALQTALKALTPARGAKPPPSAIVLISDGASDVGSDPLAVARQAAARHIPIYTVVLGTATGTVTEKRGTRTVKVPVPPDPQQLAQIARISHGQSFTAADATRLDTVYEHLGAELSHRHVKREITAGFAGGGLVLLLLGSAGSLAWFGRLV